MRVPLSGLLLLSGALLISSCSNNKTASNEEMVRLLASVNQEERSAENQFSPEAKLIYNDSLLKGAMGFQDSATALYFIANNNLELGNEQKTIDILEDLLKRMPTDLVQMRKIITKDLALAWMRMGERMNCIQDHAAESCIFPVAGRGVHQNKTGSQKAIELFESILKTDTSDLETRWLLNIAYMTTGGYPKQVPPAYLLKGLDADTGYRVKPFTDVAANIGLDTHNMAGGSIIDDFNNDGYLDIITSGWGLGEGMHYCRNNGNGTFTDASDTSGLKQITGGLNIQQIDYNNDGWKDIFVLRGAWKGKFGKEPNSLLRNNGDGTFTDVTAQSHILSFHPTQTATWADFNNDGWIDVFIGNETSASSGPQPCELYLNNKDGSFTEVAKAAGCEIVDYIKGVTSADYNNDGWPDIFISSFTGQKVLLKNEGIKEGALHFKNVTAEASLSTNAARSFTTWFWDYDNDGWPDILVCGYEFEKSLAWYTAAESLNRLTGNSGKIFLYRNRHDGTFEEVSEKVGLNKEVFAMGANFGDIDNDGYLDMYFGTGNPQYRSLIPNKLFLNLGGQQFADVTTSSRTGNLQKGHGVSFADLDNDGDEDICEEMGGAYVGDIYPNSFYLNPGQNNNHWIDISLEGVTDNRAAIGARIKVTFKDNGKERSVYRDVNSGGSFGSNPLLQHIGVGQATVIDNIEIKWPVEKKTQVFAAVPIDQSIAIKQGDNNYSTRHLKKVDFTSIHSPLISCSPKKANP